MTDDITRDNHAWLDEVQRIAQLGSWSLSPDGGAARWSAEQYRIYGRSADGFEPTSANWLACLHPDDRSLLAGSLERLRREEQDYDIAYRIVRPDGEVRHLRGRARSFRGSDRHVTIVGTDQDVTDIERVRGSLERTNRALQTLSACNAALVRAVDEAALLQNVCRILVERGGYEAVWVGVLDDDTAGRLTPAFAFGHIDANLHAAIPLDGKPETRTPFAQALRERRPVLVTDVATDSRCTAWRHMEYGSCLVLPLFTDDAPHGVLAIYTRKGDRIEADAAALLEEMAGDLSYGITALRARHERDRVQQALVDSEYNLRTVIERVAEGMLVLDPDGRVLYANPAAVNLLGRPRDRLLGKPLGLPHVVGELVEVRVLQPGGTIASADMRVVDAEWYGEPALIIALHDTTAQREAQEQMRVWARVFECSRELIVITDSRRRIIAANRAFEILTGYTADAVLGVPPDFLMAVTEKGNPPERLWQTVSVNGHWQGEIIGRRRDDSPLPLWAAISAAPDEQGSVQHYIVIASDISEKKEAEARIEYLAYHDALTGLANRALLDAQLETVIARARRSGSRFGVLFIDLDRFKNINDILGHRAGDELLIQVAQRLRNGVREEDTVCRQGGDEFVVLLPELAQPTNIAAAASKLLRSVSEPFKLSTTQACVTASIGIAVYPEDGKSGEVLVHNADTAMYYAKERGRDNFQFYMEELNRRVIERLKLENDLRRAVDRGEFELYYQPQIRGVDGTVVGAEALLRWHSDGALIMPELFVRTAEETGLIIPIGDWVVEQACRQHRQWLNDGLPALRIAVNVSASQFNPQEMQRLHRTMRKHGVDPLNIELELTESVLMQEAESSVELLKSLKASGLSLAIDDFGTGYSSLNYLRRFPIDRIKVDQSFVRDLATDPVDRAVTETIVALARSLHVAVVAEGVETANEVAFLCGLDCDELQGFYYSKPLPAPEFARWWRQRMAESADGCEVR